MKNLLARSLRCPVPIFAAALALLATLPATAAEEGLQELRLPSLLVEQEVSPETAFELPSATYPLSHVEQNPFHGSWHEFVKVTTGGLVFRMADMKLPGRMPIDFGRVYDSKVSDSLPPPPPGGVDEARWTEDLGKNWVLGYTSYLIPLGPAYNMATTDGDVIRWVPQGGGLFLPYNATASKHLRLQAEGPMTFVETQTDGTRWTFVYGVASGGTHALTKIEDRSGNYIEMIYGIGRLVEIRNSDEESLTLHRDNINPAAFPLSRVTSITDEHDPPRAVLFDYNTDGLLTQVTDVLGHDWTFAYGTNDKLTSATDPLGNTYLTATYNAQHRVATYEAQSGPWTFTYSGVRTLVDDAYAHRWEYQHGGNGITTKVTEPAGGIHNLTFDAQRNPSGYIDPEGVAVSWVYNSNHLPTSYTPAGVGANAITYAYDSTNLWVNSVTSLEDGITSFTRDAAGRVLTETKPDGGAWTATYDPATGDRLTLTLPLGNAPGGSGYDWGFGYDALGQITTATDPTGREFEFEYTAAGDLWRFRRPDHQFESQTVMAEWVYTRDASGKITGITDPLGNTWTRDYDDAGRLVEVAGPAGTTVQYAYDARHRVTTSTAVDGVNDPTTSYGYDAAGRLITKTLPTGSIWTYGYDASSRLISVTDPLDRSWTYTRDLAGRLETVTHPGGQVVTMVRDAAGRLSERTIPGGRIESFGYDPSTGRITSAEADIDSGDWIGRLDWTYDVMGRPDSVKTTITEGASPHYRELQLGYDLNGNRTSLEAPVGGETLSYEYDELDRLIATDSNAYDPWSIVYDPDSGHRTNVWAINRSKTWSYDMAGRMKTEVWNIPGEEDDGTFSYVYDAEGRAISGYDAVTGLTFATELDALGLPAEFSVLLGTEVQASATYSFDAAGQLVGKTRTFGTLPPEEMVFDRDAAGRLIYARKDYEVRIYTWDDEPDDPSAALRVWRAPMTNTEPTAEIMYGFDGRLQKILHHSLGQAEPTLVLDYLWSPLAADRAFMATELVAEETYDTRRLVLDLGGYYAEVGAELYASGEQALNPVLDVDQARSALDLTRGERVPDVAAPFGLGRFGGPDDLTRPTLAGVVSGLFRGGRAEREVVLGAEERGLPGLAGLDAVRPAVPDVLDGWLEAPLRVDRQHGEAVALFTQAGQGAAAGAGPADSYGTNGSYYDPTKSDYYCFKGFCLPFPGEFICDCGDVGVPHELGDGPDQTPTCCGWTKTGGPPPDGDPSPCDFEFESDVVYPASLQMSDISDGGVSLVNGELIHQVTDLSVFDAGGTIDFTRTYHSAAAYNGELGHKWVSNWGEKILIGVGPEYCGSIARWVRPDGGMIEFTVTESGGSVQPPDSEYRLRKVNPSVA